MKGEIKEYRVKAKGSKRPVSLGSTTDYCGRLDLRAEHDADALLLAMLARVIFKVGANAGRMELALWLAEQMDSPIDTDAFRQLVTWRDHQERRLARPKG